MSKIITEKMLKEAKSKKDLWDKGIEIGWGEIVLLGKENEVKEKRWWKWSLLKRQSTKL